MKPESEARFARIANLRGEIAKLQEQVTQELNQCEHLDYEVELVETFVYDMAPSRICMVCRKDLGKPTDEEKRTCWRQYYEDLELEATDAEIETHLNGKNIGL